jgi:hypothetical protein
MAKDAEGGTLEGKSLEELARAEQDAQQAAQGKAADDAAVDKDDQDDGEADDKDDDKAAGDDDADDPLMLAKWFDEVTGSKEAKNYTNDHEWARGMKEALGLVGKRSEDAQLGSKVLAKFRGREDELLALLDEKQPAKKADGDGNGAPEWNPAWLTVEDGKVVVTASAPADVWDRYQQVQTRLQQMAADPAKFFREAMAGDLKRIEAAQAKTTQQIDEDREDATVQGLCLKNRALLFVDGNPDSGMTVEGTKINEMVADEAWKPKITDWATRVETAIDIVKGHRPVDRSRKPPRKAMRKADVATATKQTKSAEERFKAGESLASVLEDEANAAKAAV